MATQTRIELIDDLDGRDADETITFALEGVQYEIDLHKKNAEALRKAFAPFLGAGRRVGGRKIPTKITQLPDARPGPDMQERAAIKKFAAANNLGKVADRGRISAQIQAAWVEAGRPR